MSIRLRRAIYLTFIIIFVCLAPLLVLYTAGYRYNLKKNKIQKTGILFLEYKPKDAAIFLNGLLRTEKSGERIDNLLPNEYTLEIKKEGYWPWQKELNVQPNLTTFAQHVILFKQAVPLLLAPDQASLILKTPRASDNKNPPYTIQQNKNQQTYLKINNRLTTRTPVSVKLPYSKDYTFISDNGEILTLLDKKNQILYLIDYETEGYSPIREVIPGVKYAEWSKKYDRLLWANDLEIWVYDFEQDKKELLTRLSQKIEEVLWHPSYDYVLFVVDNTVKIIEKDGRDQRNVYDLVKLERINQLMADKDGGEIYFLGKVGNQEGLYELEIQ